MVGTVWAFVALAFVGGVVLGAVLPLWQRAALQNDVKVLEKRLADKQSTDDEAQGTIEDLEEKIASLETSTEDLAALNSQLTSEVASLRATQQAQTPAAPAAPAAPGTTAQQKGTTSAGAPVIVERSVAPSNVSAGGSVTLVVKTRGADKAYMRIDGPSGNSYDITYGLKKVGTEGDLTVWSSVWSASHGTGQFRCIASASRGSRRVTAAAIPLTVN